MTRLRTRRARKRGKASSSSARPSSPRRDQIPAATGRLWRRYRELTLLNAVASAAHRHLELKTVLNVALKETLALMRVRAGIIWLYEQTRRHLVPTAHRGISTALLRELHGLRLGKSFSGAVAATRKPLVISDVREDARTIGSPSARRGLCAYAGIPILCRRKVLGVFALFDSRAHRFTKEDIALLRRIANQVGVAIENALLYEEVHRDLAARKRAEAALRESEERFRVVFERASLGIALVAFRGRILHANPAFHEMLGYTADELRGKNIAEITHPDGVKAERNLLRAVIAGRQSRVHVEKRYVRKDGRIVWADVNCYVHRDAAGKSRFVIGMVENITERKLAEERLKTYQKRLRSLASQLALAEERQRRRIATALHDEVGQDLALARLKLGELASASPRQKLTALVQPVYEMIENVLERTRSLTFELSPPVLYELGFENALGWLVEEFHKQHLISWEFRGECISPPLEDDVRVTLFQGARELFINVVKHSQAQTVKVRVERDPQEVRIRVEDDGVGFAADELWSNHKAMSGFGLFSLRERLESLGGRLEVDSQPGRGTRATLAAPLASRDVPSRGG
jgi:PAS domain S-box-containing protein